MDHRAVEHAKLRLAKAEKSAEIVRYATSLETSEEAWTDYLVAVISDLLKAGAGRKEQPEKPAMVWR